MHGQVYAKVQETLEKAKQIFGREFPMPKIHFDLQGRTAGSARASENLIRINPILLRENGDTFIARTVPHEVAHLITRQVYGMGRNVKPHGPEWRSVMVRLGLPPTRCHSYDVTNSAIRTRARHSVFCACMEHKVTEKVVRKIEMGSVYKCRKCRSQIKAHEPVMRMGARAGAIIS